MLNNMFSSFDQKNFIFMSYMFINLTMMITLSMMNRLDKFMLMQKKTLLILYSNISTKKMMVSMFIMIFMLNILSLNMFSFSMTSQTSTNIMMVLTIWFPLMIINLTKKKNSFLEHLLPMGTSNFLIPMMIVIELLSYMMRPMTLILRLTINLMAGHILVTLLSNLILEKNVMFMNLMMIYMMMKLLVSVIQSYIITTLIQMYEMEMYVK